MRRRFMRLLSLMLCLWATGAAAAKTNLVAYVADANSGSVSV
jgi:hypothetical protein